MRNMCGPWKAFLVFTCLIALGAGCVSGDVMTRVETTQATVEASTGKIKTTIDHVTTLITKLRALQAIVDDEDGSVSQAAIEAASEEGSTDTEDVTAQ